MALAEVPRKPPPKFPNNTNKLVHQICEQLISEWPPAVPDTTLDEINALITVNAYSFWTCAFRPKLQLAVNRASNVGTPVSGNLYAYG